MKISQGKKGGRGTHGSLTKSGKVRAQTLKIEKTSQRKSKQPSITNRSRFRRMDYNEKHKDERKPYET